MNTIINQDIQDNVDSDKKITEIQQTISRTEGGLLKRIDENRELMELLERDAPELLAEKPWVRRWLESQDTYLRKVAAAAEVLCESPNPLRNYPRPMPEKFTDPQW
ncbi:hypothetical protein KC224_03245 [Cedecea davisae]|uniref:hypothetical protein n=1 Tax=Cedecea davisae TaxID=158484 RepID=UPI001C0F34EE|nr:hypothetical protein [Cedecea davisae]MBU4685528.1 hypothetical protein [Cedecea davisae]